MTIIPYFDAALQSILSTPVPARPMIFKFGHCDRTSSLSFVADLMTTPS